MNIDDLIKKLDAEDDALIDTCIDLFWRVTSSMLHKIKEKEPLLFAALMVQMAVCYKEDSEAERRKAIMNGEGK